MGLIKRAARRCLLLAAITAGLAVPSAQAAPLPLLSHHGRWLTDPTGRVAILHGVQIDKFKPGAPGVEGWIDISPLAAPFIANEGFNLVRDSVSYAAVEPQLGQFDDSYLQPFLAFDRQLASAGIYDLIDMMQGQYAAAFEGTGFPSWMVITDGVPNMPGPFPQSYLYDPAEERAWDNLWANRAAADGVGLQDHYAAGLRHVAQALSGGPAVIGYDLLNEPWAGSQWPTCVNPAGCPLFDQQLNAFYRRIIPALRTADPRHLAFYEPHALFDQGAASSIGAVGDPNSVFTFHNYCLGDQPGLPQADPGQDCGVEEQIVLANAEAQAAHQNDALLEDEWGNTASVPLLQRMAAQADQHMVGWSYWAYEDCCNSPGAIVNDATKDPNAPGNLNVPVLDALVRPYPQLIAGTPTSWGYDPASNAFTLGYSTQRVAGGQFPVGSRTEIFVPRRRYPSGYRVTATGAGVLRQLDAQHLILASCPGAATVSVRVADGGGQSGACEFDAGGHVCPFVAGSLRGKRLGPFTLGMTRARARRLFPRFATRGRRYMDFFCLSPSGIRAGYPSPKLLRTLTRSDRRRVKGRMVLVLTDGARYALHGIRTGAPVGSLRRELRAARAYRVGRNTWYLIADRQATGVLKAQRGMIIEVGVADKRLTSSRKAARRFLRSFY